MIPSMQGQICWYYILKHFLWSNSRFSSPLIVKEYKAFLQAPKNVVGPEHFRMKTSAFVAGCMLGTIVVVMSPYIKGSLIPQTVEFPTYTCWEQVSGENSNRTNLSAATSSDIPWQSLWWCLNKMHLYIWQPKLVTNGLISRVPSPSLG